MGGDGWHDDELTEIEDVAQRRWMARWQLDGKGRRDGDSTMMDDEEGARAMAMSTQPAMRAKGQRGIKL